MKIEINTDGGFAYGRASIGYKIAYDGKVIMAISRESLAKTNNQAEYEAMYEALKEVWSKGVDPDTEVVLYADSQLMVKHFNGEFNVSNQELIAIMNRIKASVTHFIPQLKVVQVPRNMNSDADWLCNIILDKF